MLTRTIAAIATLALLAGCRASAPAESVQQMMKNKVQPTAQIYWDAVQYISDESGNRDIVPQTDADWEKVRKAAADRSSLQKPQKKRRPGKHLRVHPGHRQRQAAAL